MFGEEILRHYGLVIGVFIFLFYFAESGMRTGRQAYFGSIMGITLGNLHFWVLFAWDESSNIACVINLCNR